MKNSHGAGGLHAELPARGEEFPRRGRLVGREAEHRLVDEHHGDIRRRAAAGAVLNGQRNRILARLYLRWRVELDRQAAVRIVHHKRRGSEGARRRAVGLRGSDDVRRYPGVRLHLLGYLDRELRRLSGNRAAFVELRRIRRDCDEGRACKRSFYLYLRSFANLVNFPVGRNRHGVRQVRAAAVARAVDV